MQDAHSKQESDFSDRFVPENVLALYTPWALIPGESDFVGPLKNARSGGWFPCDQTSERIKDTPVVVDHFLSWAMSINSPRKSDHYTLFDQYEPVSIGEHTHDLSHAHSFTLRDWTDTRRGEGGRATVSSPLHEHKVSLPLTHLKVKLDSVFDPDNPETPRYLTDGFEPPHYEVNAYYTRTEREIPPGLIVFYPGTEDIPGWRCLTKEGLDFGDLGTGEDWQDVLLKVVGCVPSRFRKGAEYHWHTVAGHTHLLDRKNPTETGVVKGLMTADGDDLGRDTGAADFQHKHEVERVGWADSGSTGKATNKPRRVGMGVYVAVSEDARFKQSMFVPFVPNDQKVLELAYDGQWAAGWRVRHKLVPDRDQLFLSSWGEFIDDVEGDIFHKHEFTHTHEITTGAPTSTGTFDSDDKVSFAAHDHRHKSVPVRDTITSADGKNVLRAREVNFLVFVGV